jgi:aromatic ring-cleaving dioxygenase
VTGKISSYHAHIYYDPQKTRSVAETLRDKICERFAVRMGRWHDVPVGPHVRAMYQVAFVPQVFPTLIPWLMLNRAGLTILIHPNTGAPRDDHLVNAFWFGDILDIKESVLPIADDVSSLELDVNTTPTITVQV